VGDGSLKGYPSPTRRHSTFPSPHGVTPHSILPSLHIPSSRIPVGANGQGLAGTHHDSCAFCIVGFLVVSHVVLDAHPGLSDLPCNSVSGCSAVESRPISKHGESKSVPLRLRLGCLLILLDCLSV